jgi:hypothetical protein
MQFVPCLLLLLILDGSLLFLSSNASKGDDRSRLSARSAALSRKARLHPSVATSHSRMKSSGLPFQATELGTTDRTKDKMTVTYYAY